MTPKATQPDADARRLPPDFQTGGPGTAAPSRWNTDVRLALDLAAQWAAHEPSLAGGNDGSGWAMEPWMWEDFMERLETASTPERSYPVVLFPQNRAHLAIATGSRRWLVVFRNRRSPQAFLHPEDRRLTLADVDWWAGAGKTVTVVHGVCGLRWLWWTGLALMARRMGRWDWEAHWSDRAAQRLTCGPWERWAASIVLAVVNSQ